MGKPTNENSAHIGRRKRPKLYNKGKRKDIVKMLLGNGGITYRGLMVYSRNQKMLYQRIIKEMESEGLIKAGKVASGKYVKICDYESLVSELEIPTKKSEPAKYVYDEKLFSSYKKNSEYVNRINSYREQITQEERKDKKKYENIKTINQRAERIYRDIEVRQIMYSLGVLTLADEKPELTEKLTTVPLPAYYTAQELKQSDKFHISNVENISISGSRSNGCLFCNDGAYMIYHSANRLLRWSNQTEYIFSSYTAKIANRIGYKIKGYVSECILLSYGIDICTRLVNPASSTRGLMTLDNKYQSIYNIPINENGGIHLKIMMRKNWKKELKEIFLEDYNTNTDNLMIPCDGYRENEYLLLYCIPDLVKLNNFIAASAWKDENTEFKIFCFDYQIPLFEKLDCNIELYSYPINDYYKAITNA